MPMLDDLMRGGSAPGGAAPMGGGPGVNPQLEQLLGRIASLQEGVKGPGGGMPPAPGPQPGMAQGPVMSQGTPQVPNQPGAAAAMAPEQANLTYQMLIKAGVPPEVAKQAISEPKFLQEILVELQKQQLGAPPQRPQGQPAPQMA